MNTENKFLCRGIRALCYLIPIALLLPGILGAQHSRRNTKGMNPYRGDYQRLSVSNYNSFEIRSGELWAWGYNSTGNLGDGTTTPRNAPVRIGNSTDWVSVHQSNSHTLALKSDGTLWAWGSNTYGQLGIGTNVQMNSPVQVGSENDWMSISAGEEFSVAIKSNGTLWTWGNNVSGQLGDGTQVSKNIPGQVGSASDWVSVSAGYSHVLAIKSNGTLWTWGAAGNQLGIGSSITHQLTPIQVGIASNWTSVSASSANFYSFGIQSNGTLWAWGNNSEGQLGDGTTTSRNTPAQVGLDSSWVKVKAGYSHVLAIKSNGTLWAWGEESNGQLGMGIIISPANLSPSQVGTATNWIDAQPGAFYSIGIQADGTRYVWGYNGNSEYGIGSNTEYYVPTAVSSSSVTNWVSVSAGNEHTVALRSDGTLWAWGNNTYGQLGDGTTTNRISPVQIGSLTNWVSVSVGYYHTMAIRSDGTLWAWGHNNGGQLGLNDNTNRNTPVQVGTANNWLSVSAGASHTMGIRSDGTLWGWGFNGSGRLGDGSTTMRLTPVKIGNSTNWVSVSAGTEHTLALRSDGTLWAWGANAYGQLGVGTTSTHTSPVQIGNSTNWVGISVGIYHSLGLAADGTAWAWGVNGYGQLGDGTTTHQSSPVQVGVSTNWLNINSDNNHSMGIKSDGTLWTWGFNAQGQLGDSSTTQRNSPVQIGNSTNWISVTAGESHTMAIQADRQHICGTGNNSSSQLGDGTTTSRNNFSCHINTLTAPPLMVSITSNSPVCSGNTLVLTADETTGATYAWLGPNGYTANTRIISLSNTNTNMAGVYTVTATLNNNTATATHTVTINATPVVAISPSGTIGYCQSGSVTLTASGGSTYLWSNSATGNTISVSSPGTFSVSSTENGCIDTSAVVTVTETSPITNNVLGANQTICFGEVPAALTGSIPSGGTGTFTYQWQSSSDNSTWGDVAGATENSYSTGRFIFHSYYRRVVSSGGCVNTSSEVSLTVNSCAPAISAGPAFTRVLCMDSSSWAWGTNFQGLIGGGNNNNSVNPTLAINLNDLVAVSAGGGFSLFLRKDGTVWATGDGRFGAMGNGTTTGINNTPVQVSGLNNIVAIEAGNGTGYALRSDGTVWGWGLNNQGQLGSGVPNQPDQLTPIQIPNLSNVIKIVGGSNHALALRSDSTVWGWGRNDFAQAGLGAAHRPTAAIAGLTGIKQIGAGDLFSIALRNDGTVVTWGGTPSVVSGLSNITDISLRTYSGTPLALRNDGVLFAWGRNNNGQVGIGTTTTNVPNPLQVSGLANVIQIASGPVHNVALLATGELFAWGNNAGGCLGDLTTTNRTSPVHVFSRPCFIIEGIGNNTISANQTICSSGTASTLTGSTPVGCGGVYTYQWESSTNNNTWASVSGETQSSLSPGSLNTSTYFRRVVTGGTCFPHPSTAVFINVEQQIGANNIVSAQTICHSNTPASITGSQPTGGIGMYNFTWLSSSDNSTFTAISGASLQDYTPGALTSTQFLKREVFSGVCPADTTSALRIEVLLPISNNVVTGNQSLCVGITPAAFNSSTPAGGTGTFTYQWESSQDNSTWMSVTGATQLNSAPSAISQNTYFRRLVNSGTCVGSTSASVYIHRLEPIGDNSIMANQTLCAPATPASISGSLPSGATGLYTYLWQSSSNMSTWNSAGGSNMNFQPGIISATTYHRRIVSSAGCHSDTSATREVLVAPIVNIISSSQTIHYEGTPTGFTGVTNAQSPTYIWETSRNNFHWNLIPGAATANYAESASLTQWAYYRRKIAVTGCDTSISNVVIVQLNDLLNDSITLSANGPICTPTPVYLSVQTPLSRLTLFNWTGPNGFTATGVNPSIMQSLEIHRGVYRCVAFDTTTNDSFVSTLHVFVSPIMSSLNVAYNQPVCEGSMLQLSAAGMPGVEYSWTGPNGFTSDRYLNRLPVANSSMNGTYLLTANSPGCGSTTRSLFVNINTIPNPLPGNNGPICISNVLSLTASIPAGSSATWSGPNGFVSNLYQPSITNAQTIHAGIYTLNVSRPGCQSVVQTTLVQVNSPVSGISVSSNSPVCASGTLQLSATSTGAQYQWNGPNGFSSTNQNPSISNVSNLQSGVYTLQVVSPGCGSLARTTQVLVITPGAISAGSNSPICAGTTLALTSTSVPGATVAWEGPNGYNSTLANPSISGAQTIRSGVYTVTVTSPGCAPSVATTTVTVSSPVSSLVAVSNSPVCEGATINLSAPSVNGVTYAWTGPQAFTASGNSASVANAALANAGSYVLSMTSPGCASVNRTLNVAIRSSSAAIAGSNSPRCTGNVLYLTVNTIAGASYLWEGPNGFTSNRQNPALSNVQPIQSGNYSLTVNIAGCGSSTLSTPVVVYPNATGIQISAAQTLCAGSTLTLTGTSVSGATMSWTGPGGFTATGSTATIPLTTLLNRGRYAYNVSMPGCGTVSRFANVTIMDGAAVSGTISSPLCTGAPMYMNANFIAGASYVWSAPDGFSSTQKSPSRIQVTVPMAGVYTLSVNVPGCGTVTQAIPVTINVCREGEDIGATEPHLEILTEADLKLNVYPNPFERELSYTSSGQTLVKVQLLDLNGSVMHQIDQPNAEGVIPNTETLSAGVYFLRFETLQGYRVVKLMRQ